MKKVIMVAFALAMLIAIPVSAADKPVTITHWYWADSQQISRRRCRQMAADFNATNGKNITVVAQEYPWDGGGLQRNPVQGGDGRWRPRHIVRSNSRPRRFSPPTGFWVNLDDYLARMERQGPDRSQRCTRQ